MNFLEKKKTENRECTKGGKMRKLTLLLGLFVAMILGLLFAASKDDGTLTEQDNSKLEQSQKVSEKGKFLQTRHRFVNTGAFKEPKKGDPVDMVYEFFELNQEEFGVTNPREELVYQGTQGSKKVKKLFIDKKIPRGRRSLIPVIAMNNQPVWIVGICLDNSVKVTRNTKKILKLAFQPSGS